MTTTVDNLETIQLLENKYVKQIRPLLSQTKFNQEFSIKTNHNKNHNHITSIFKYINPIRILNVFTIFNLIAEYNILCD